MNVPARLSVSRVLLRGGVVVAVAAMVTAVTAVTACEPRARRDDWRHPGRPHPCASDLDCPGGKCALEVGATTGACAPAEPLPQLPPTGGPGDGGAPNAPPPPVQPGPNDIQI